MDSNRNNRPPAAEKPMNVIVKAVLKMIPVWPRTPAGTDLTSTTVGTQVGLDVNINNAALAVTGTFWQATQPVSGPVAPATTITEYSVTLTVIDTEYSQALPAGTKKIFYHSTAGKAFRASYATGKVATPTQPYEAVAAGTVCFEDNVNLTSVTLYLASAVAGDIIFVRCWT